MADKCPYCYRNLGTWKNDPILLPHGAECDWIDDTHLVYEPDEFNRWYRGLSQIGEEVQEIQTALKILEVDILAVSNWTKFSPINTTGKFQITGKHIKEMRDSVEKILIANGLTKIDYFNYDEEGNHILNPLIPLTGDKTEWTDPITVDTDLQKFQVKYIHIEDLRHYLEQFKGEFFNNTGSIYSDPAGYAATGGTAGRGDYYAWWNGDFGKKDYTPFEADRQATHDEFVIGYPWDYPWYGWFKGSGIGANGDVGRVRVIKNQSGNNKSISILCSTTPHTTTSHIVIEPANTYPNWFTYDLVSHNEMIYCGSYNFSNIRGRAQQKFMPPGHIQDLTDYIKKLTITPSKLFSMDTIITASDGRYDYSDTSSLVHNYEVWGNKVWISLTFGFNSYSDDNPEAFAYHEYTYTLYLYNPDSMHYPPAINNYHESISYGKVYGGGQFSGIEIGEIRSCSLSNFTLDLYNIFCLPDKERFWLRTDENGIKYPVENLIFKEMYISGRCGPLSALGYPMSFGGGFGGAFGGGKPLVYPAISISAPSLSLSGLDNITAIAR